MRRLILLLLLAGAALSACGGGGGASASMPPGGSGSHTNQATISVLIPTSTAAAGAKRIPTTISPGTAQLEFTVVSVNGAAPNPAQPPLVVSITNPQYCTATSGGTSCTVAVAVPIAKAVVIQIATLDANGHELGVGTTGAIDTTQATIPQQSISLGGVATTIVLGATAGSALDDGAMHQISISVSAKDASGNLILPPGTYSAPIALSIANDPNGALSLSTTTIASPGATGGVSTVTLTYDSSKSLPSQAIVTAQTGTSSNSLLFAALVVTPLNVNALAVGGTNGSLTVSEAGYGGAYTISAPTFVTTSCAPSNCTPATPGGAVTINVSPVSSGSGALTIGDLTGGSGAIPVAVAQTSGGGGLVGGPYHIYEYSTGATGSNYGMTVGASGKTLWFVDRTNATLGYVLNPASCNGSTCSVGEIPPSLPGTTAKPAALQSIAAGPDGNLYVTDVGNYASDLGSVFQVACNDATGACASGTQTTSLSSLATPAPSDVAVAPDGNLYFTSAYSSATIGSSILAISPPAFSAVPTTYHINAAASPSQPAFLTYDAYDQHIWFTDTGDGNVGFFPLGCSFTVTCTVTEQPSNSSVNTLPAMAPRNPNGGIIGTLPTPLAGIVAASDGSLYVAAPGAHEIIRLNAAAWLTCIGSGCADTIIALPQANASPQALTIGSDGNVWFTDTSGYIGMISIPSCATACKAYEYAVPTQAGAPWGIVNGPDGNIWFTESASPKIGEVVLR